MFSLLQININLLVVSLAVYDIAKLIDFHLFYFYAFIHVNHWEQIVILMQLIFLCQLIDPYFHVFYVLEELSVLLLAGFKSTTHKHNHSFSFFPKTP